MKTGVIIAYHMSRRKAEGKVWKGLTGKTDGPVVAYHSG